MDHWLKNAKEKNLFLRFKDLSQNKDPPIELVRLDMTIRMIHENPDGCPADLGQYVESCTIGTHVLRTLVPTQDCFEGDVEYSLTNWFAMWSRDLKLGEHSHDIVYQGKNSVATSGIGETWSRWVLASDIHHL